MVLLQALGSDSVVKEYCVAMQQNGPDASVLQAWGGATSDPDAAAISPEWLQSGAPTGILEPIEYAGVFPPVPPDTPRRKPADLFSDLTGWTNNRSAEDEPEVVRQLLEEQYGKGHCR